MEWSGSEENMNVMSECEEDEGIYWVDGDSDINWLRQIECHILCE